METGRFAPSPSGYMHMGNLLAMLLAWLDIRALGGRMIFRMEDLDPARSRPEYAQAMERDLTRLGLDWDEGWPDPAFSQSRRTAVYQEAFHTLERQQLVYPCYCTRAQRSELETAGRRPAWKIKVPSQTVSIQDGHYGLFTQNLAQDVGDFIIRRADGVYAYQLAVSADDMEMGITRVVRGHDLLSSSPRQAWLIQQLGGTPPAYCHGPLLVSGKNKLSKRYGSLSTQALRQTYTPEALTGLLAYLAGLIPKPEPVSAGELAADFSWGKVSLQDTCLGEELPDL